MFKFHFIRSMRDLVGHLVLIAFPAVLIALFNFIFSGVYSYFELPHTSLSWLCILTIGFALTFQIYGASISFESIGVDFFSPMRDRLMASPVNCRNLVVSTITVGCLVSFLQTLVVLLFSMVILKAEIGFLYLVLPLFLLSVIVNQFLGTVILLLTRSMKTANTILTIYAIIAPMSMGLYFPLPQNTFFTILRNYLTPAALANSAILGVLEGDGQGVLVGTGALVVLCCVLFILFRPLIRRLSA